jgi:hypothetical protein
MKKLFTLITFTAAFAALLISSPEFAIAKPFLDKIEREYGAYAKRRAVALVQMMNEARDLDEMGKLERVNEFLTEPLMYRTKKCGG